MNSAKPYDVVIAGAGYAGLMAALRLTARKASGLSVALINAENHFAERVRLQEEIVAPVKPRLPSLSRYLAGTQIDFVHGVVTSIDPLKREVMVERDHESQALCFRELIYALGSRVDTEEVSGVKDNAFRLDSGHGPLSPHALRRVLEARPFGTGRVVVAGGGPLAVEVAGEIKSRWQDIDVTVVSSGRAGDFQTPTVTGVLRDSLTRLGVALLDDAPVTEIRSDRAITAGGSEVPYDICVWAGGMRAPSVARDAGLSVDDKNRVLVGPDLRSTSHPDFLAVGDAAHPIAPTGAPYRPSALTAALTGVYAAEEILAARESRQSPPFSFSTFAQAVAIGRYAAVFPLTANDRQTFFVVGGQPGRWLRSALIWLVMYFIKFEKTFPGIQSWPGRRRVSRKQAEAAVNDAAGNQSST